MEGLETKVLDKKPCEISLEVEITKAQVEDARENAFIKIHKSASLDGFRVGKAPIELVKTKFKATAEREMIQQLVSSAIPATLTKEKLNPLFYPEVTALDFTEAGSLKFNMSVEIAPEFDVKDYKGLKIKEKKIDVTDKEIEDYTKMIFDKDAKLENDEDGVIKKNSFVLIDYVGKKDGIAFDGGTENDKMLSIENSGFIEGFAEGLVGLKLNDSKDLNLKFPKEYHAEDLAGKDVVFSVKVKEIKKKILPELTDEYVSGFGIKTVEEFKTKIKENMLREKEYTFNREMEDEIVKDLIKANDISVPKTIVENELNKMLENMKNQYSRYGYKDFDVEPMRDRMRPDAERNIKAFYILNAIIEKEKLEPTDQDFLDKQNKLISEDKASEEKIKEYYKKNKNNLMFEIRQEKLFKFLLDNAKK
jgi:trigger factor